MSYSADTHLAPLHYPTLCTLFFAGSGTNTEKRHPAAHAALGVESAAAVHAQLDAGARARLAVVSVARASDAGCLCSSSSR
ncbi:hypothetical protein B0H11DRAFT_2251148 [Mycena galericulata]|nr:hypothetical protein B0H11DRAFT_2251148 [Mycena galericulata]